jgi:hypothetical protein
MMERLTAQLISGKQAIAAHRDALSKRADKEQLSRKAREALYSACDHLGVVDDELTVALDDIAPGWDDQTA